MKKIWRATAVAAIAFLAGTTAAMAQQSWPNRPIKLVIPYPPGGTSDPLARSWTDRLQQELGQPFVIESRAGASATIGTEAVAKSAPDGYTFLFTPNAPITVNPQFRKVNYDPINDLIPVARVGDVVSGFVVPVSLPIKNMADLIAYAKANPGKLAYGSPGPGSATHMRIEVIKLRTGVDIAYVPYKGAGEAIVDLLAGTIQIMNDPNTYAHIRAGKFRMLALNNPTRIAEFPDVPTLTEAGFPDADIPIWYALYAPAKTPMDIVNRLNAVIVRLSDDPEVKSRLAQLNSVAPKQTPAEVAAFVKKDQESIATLIRQANIKLE